MERKIQTKPNSQTQQGFYQADMNMLVITRIVAPKLTDFRKSIEIQNIKKFYESVYTDLTEKEKELIDHLDRAFRRTAFGMAWLSTSSISKALRVVTNDNSVTVKGIILVDPKLISIYAEYRSTTQGSSMEVYEYIREGSVINARVLINKRLEGPYILALGAKRDKGFGQVRVDFKYPE